MSTLSDKVRAKGAIDEIRPNDQEILAKGFNHPCEQTCIGWTQGRTRGVFDENTRLQPLLELLGEALEALERYRKDDEWAENLGLLSEPRSARAVLARADVLLGGKE